MKQKKYPGNFIYLILLYIIFPNMVMSGEIVSTVSISISGYNLDHLGGEHKLVAKLLDVTYEDAPSITISKIENTAIISDQLVIKLPYTYDDINQRNRYSVQVEIYVKDEFNEYHLYYFSQTSNPVITQGYSTNIDIQVIKVVSNHK